MKSAIKSLCSINNSWLQNLLHMKKKIYLWLFSTMSFHSLRYLTLFLALLNINNVVSKSDLTLLHECSNLNLKAGKYSFAIKNSLSTVDVVCTTNGNMHLTSYMYNIYKYNKFCNSIQTKIQQNTVQISKNTHFSTNTPQKNTPFKDTVLY